MKTYEIEVMTTIEVTTENISDIVSSAFSDTSLWSGYCGGYPVDEIPKGTFTSDFIANGGKYMLVDNEDDDEEYLLTDEKILDGIGRMYEDVGNTFNEWGTSFEWIKDGKIVDMDSWLADCIIQYAVLGDIVYG